MGMPPFIQKTLRDIGLSKNEALVFGVLLQSGTMLASRISQKARLNRTTTYGVLKELIKKGLVSKDERHGTGVYQSMPPKLLPDYVARRREELVEQEKELRKIIPQLTLLRKQTQSLPNVRFFEGVEGVKQAFEDTLINNKGKALYDFTGVDAVFQRMGKEWVNYYFKKRTRLGIQCTVLAPETVWSREMKKEDAKFLRTTKFIPECFSFDTEVDVYDDKVGIFSFAQEHPVAVIIEDKTIAHTIKTFFDFMALHAH